MAITTLDQLVAASRQNVDYVKTASAVTVALQPSSLLDVAGSPGAGSLVIGNTTTGVVPVGAGAGFPTLQSFAGNPGYLAALGFSNTVACRLALKDRIFHVGSISMTALATTTLSGQPSFLSRCPGGAGYTNEIWLEIQTGVSATATTVAVGYTNAAGTTGRTTGASASLSGYTARRLLQLPLQAGDTGVSVINSVTIGGTVATTGAVNVIVARPLVDGMRVPVAGAGDTWSWDKTGLIRVYDTSALWPVVYADSTSSGIPDLFATIVSG